MADLGQHLLRDDHAIARVIQAANLQPGQTVLDAGAGTGALTRPIAEAVGATGRVYAVDVDPAMLQALRSGLPPQVHIVDADILGFPFPDPLHAVVANPPFKIAAPFLERVARSPIPLAVLVLPRELIDRLVAPPGSERYGKLTIRTALRAHVKDLGTLSRHAFAPPPEVPCGFIRMLVHSDAPPLDEATLELVLDTARTSWDRKAKRAFGPLVDQLRADSAGLTRLLADAGWAERRTSDLPPDAFAAVARYLTDRDP